MRIISEKQVADPIARAAAAAPLDDEPVTEEDRKRIFEGQRWFAERGGKGIDMEEVLAEFGLRAEDFAPLPADGSEAYR